MASNVPNPKPAQLAIFHQSLGSNLTGGAPKFNYDIHWTNLIQVSSVFLLVDGVVCVAKMGGSRSRGLVECALIYVLLVAIEVAQTSSANMFKPFNVSYDHRAIIVDGKRRMLISAGIHYPRATPQVHISDFAWILRINESLHLLLLLISSSIIIP